MKVLFHAYNTCCQTESGGVQVRVRRIKELLESIGIQVDLFNPYETDIRDYDVVHIFMLTLESENIIRCAKTLGKKVVLSSIINVNNYRKARRNRKILPILCRLGVRPVDSVLTTAINMCDVVIAETPAEARHINWSFGYPLEKIKIIPNGCDEIDVAGDEIYGLIGGKKRYVLQVGRIDANKNLLNVIKAVKGADYDLVVIGGQYAAGSSSYLDECKKESYGCQNIHFLGWLPAGSVELRSAYINAQALVVPSYQETFGLVILEGAMAGARVCLSNTLPILEFGVFDKEYTFSPENVDEIRVVLNKAMAAPRDESLRLRVKEFFSWDRIAKEHIEIYNND